MATVLTWLTSTALWQSISTALGLVKQRDSEDNNPAMVANAEAQKAQAERDEDAAALEKGSLDEVRKRSS